MISLDDIELPADLVWTDEFDWTPAQQQESYLLTGSLLLERSFKQAGRPITLAESTAPVWLPRLTVEALYGKLTVTMPMILTLADARVFSVAFDHNKGPIQVKPVYEYSTYDATDYYNVQALRFISL